MGAGQVRGSRTSEHARAVGVRGGLAVPHEGRHRRVLGKVRGNVDALALNARAPGLLRHPRGQQRRRPQLTPRLDHPRHVGRHRPSLRAPPAQ